VDLLQSVSGQGAGTVVTPAGPDMTPPPNSEAMDNSPFLGVLISLTAGSTPSLTPTVQWSYDGSTWFDGDRADTMTAIAAVGNKAKSFTRKAPFHRVSVVVAGTGVAYTVRTWCFGA
jgi:hypothetical protein